jgi:hypothetical protein
VKYFSFVGRRYSRRYAFNSVRVFDRNDRGRKVFGSGWWSDGEGTRDIASMGAWLRPLAAWKIRRIEDLRASSIGFVQFLSDCSFDLRRVRLHSTRNPTAMNCLTYQEPRYFSTYVRFLPSGLSACLDLFGSVMNFALS